MELKETIRRLKLTLRQLKKAKPENFNMGTWMEKGEHCNTVACAAGHATQNRTLRKLGLKLVKGNNCYRESNCYYPTYKSHWGWEALIVFYGLDRTDIFYLFDKEKYQKREGQCSPYKRVTLPEVIERFETFIREKEKEYETGKSHSLDQATQT